MKFRFKALEKRRAPDQLDSPMLLASPQGWVATFVVLITTLLITLWGFLGQLPRTMTLTGYLSSGAGLSSVTAPLTGSVAELLAASEDDVANGDTVARIVSADGQSVEVKANAAGRVVGLNAVVGDTVTFGQPLLDIERTTSTDDDLVAVLFVSPHQSSSVHAGQNASITVPGVSPRAFGLLRGTVSDVGEYPSTPREVRSITGTSTGGAVHAVSVSSETPAPYIARVELTTDKDTFSGYEWTSTDGPPVTLKSRTPISVDIEVAQQSPLSLLFGM